MVIKKLELKPLTREAFAPYGDVIEFERREFFHINDGMVERYHDLAKVDVFEQEGRPLMNLLRAKPNTFPIRVKFVERHPWSSQAFFPLSDNPFVVVVAAPGDTVSPADLKAFITNGRQGVNYHRMAWHHILLVPHKPMEFLLVDRGGPGKNCDEFWFAAADQLLLEL